MIKPMLCKLQDKPFNSERVIWEPKYDGVRILAKVDAAGYKLQARSGADKTNLFPELKLASRLPAVFDGEIVAMSGKFNGIQHRANRINGIANAVDQHPVIYKIFDILELDGVDMTATSLENRKGILTRVLTSSENVSESKYTHDGVQLFDWAKENQQEGIVGKSLAGRYMAGKREWLKVKCWQEEEFLVVGFTKGTGWRASTFGALVLSDNKGNYVGSVGTGFDNAEIERLCERFMEGTCPFPREPEQATWVQPFAVKVKFLEKTSDGMLRFPSYKGVV